MTIFRHDRPITRIEDDILWGTSANPLEEGAETREISDEVDIREEIEGIASAIAEPLDGTPRESLTFAVFGRWGLGKSSAMQMIRSHADRLAASRGGSAVQLLHCDYNAADNEYFAKAYGHDVRTTLGIAMIKAVAGQDPKRIVRILFDHAAPFVESEGEHADDLASSHIAVFDKLQAVARRLSHLIDYDVVIGKMLADQRESAGVLAVYIDDLDRCDAEFVWQVMSTIQQWSRIPNLFFVIAMDRHHLRRAMQERTGHSSDVEFALEKYIQHSVHVPEMNRDRMQAYLRSLGALDTGSQDILDMLVENSRLLYHGLRVQTPRSVKRFVNTFCLAFKRHLAQDPPPASADTKLFLKKLILKYSWPVFYDAHYLLAIEDRERGGRGDHVSSFQTLEGLCADYAGNPDESRLRFELQRLQQRMGIDWSDLDLNLANYLGQRPFLLQDEPKAESNVNPKQYVRANSSLDNVQSEDEDVLPNAFANAKQVIWTLRQQYFEIRAACNEGNRAKAVELANEAYRLVRENAQQFQESPKTTASLIGDIAGALASIEAVAEAVRLFQLSFDYEPEPRVLANNIHRYVAVIVTQELGDLYGDANELLQRLREPPYNEHRPEYTDALFAGLMIATGQGGSHDGGVEQSAFLAKVEEFEADPSEEWVMVGLAGAAQARGDFETMARIVRARYEHDTNPDGAYQALRLLADGLVGSDDNRDVEIGIELFIYLIDHATCVSNEAKEHLHALCFNCANSLYKLDYDDFAGKLFFEAYRDNPAEPLIQRGYGSYLARAKRPDLAARVHRGDPLTDDEMVLASATKVLPESFLPEGYDAWWTRKEMFQRDCDRVRERLMS